MAKFIAKDYYNCDPLSDDNPVFFDGNFFEFQNGGNSTVWLALESRLIVDINPLGLPDDVTNYRFGSGRYDPATVVKVRPNETIKLWMKDTACEASPDCSGLVEREIVYVRRDGDSRVRTYNFDDYDPCNTVCCMPEQKMTIECCPEGDICDVTCVEGVKRTPCV